MSNPIRVLACPQCGGSLRMEQRACGYCGISVLLSNDRTTLIGNESSCPTCLTHSQPGERFCGQCARPLLVDCPSKSCRASNSVWRKYCLKCGIEIEVVRQQIIDEERMVNLEQLSVYEHDLLKAYDSISKARSRERAVKIFIAVAALILGLVIATLSLLFGVVISVVILLFAMVYSSDEIENLASSLEICERRVVELRSALGYELL